MRISCKTEGACTSSDTFTERVSRSIFADGTSSGGCPVQEVQLIVSEVDLGTDRLQVPPTEQEIRVPRTTWATKWICFHPMGHWSSTAPSDNEPTRAPVTSRQPKTTWILCTPHRGLRIQDDGSVLPLVSLDIPQTVSASVSFSKGACR